MKFRSLGLLRKENGSGSRIRITSQKQYSFTQEIFKEKHFRVCLINCLSQNSKFFILRAHRDLIKLNAVPCQTVFLNPDFKKPLLLPSLYIVCTGRLKWHPDPKAIHCIASCEVGLVRFCIFVCPDWVLWTKFLCLFFFTASIFFIVILIIIFLYFYFILKTFKSLFYN